jgi:GH43 family beta-xylosidase
MSHPPPPQFILAKALKRLRLCCLLLYSSTVCFSQTFINPIIPHGADPSVTFVEGTYYSVRSGCAHPGGTPAICITASRSLVTLGNTQPTPVWTAPLTGPNSHDIWAPEIEHTDGRWYIYYAADPDANPHHGLFALVPKDPSKPLGDWVEADTGNPSGGFKLDWKSDWAIDPSTFRAADGKLYLLFACRQDNTDRGPGRFQSICIAQMSDPLHLAADSITGHKVFELSFPTQPWERRGFPTQEGPFGFTHAGVDYILYSASFSGTADQYAEGILINRHPPQPTPAQNPLLNPASWVKEGPVFDGHHAAYGTASSVLTQSPDGSELWHVYHGTNCLDGCILRDNKTWADRSDRAQQAFWSATGDLVLGYPADIADTDGHGNAVPLAVPSRNGGGQLALPPWGDAFGDAAEGNTTAGTATGKWIITGPASVSLAAPDAARFDRIFYLSNPNFQSYTLYSRLRLTGPATPTTRYGLIAAYVDHGNYLLALIAPHGCNNAPCLTTEGLQAGQPIAPLACPLPATFDPTATNTLTIEAASGTLTLFLNDIPLTGPCQSRTVHLSAGQVYANGSNGQTGVAAQSAALDVSDFTVSYGVPLDSNKTSTLYAFRNAQTHLDLTSPLDPHALAPRQNPSVTQAPPSASYPLTSSPNQMWNLQQHGDVFAIESSSTGLCLSDADGSSPASTARCNNSPNQRWWILPAYGGFLIRNVATLLALDPPSTLPGAALTPSPRTNSTSQQWQLLIP